jgi:hypothetical protein
MYIFNENVTEPANAESKPIETADLKGKKIRQNAFHLIF